MPKYLIQASYTSEGLKGLLKDGGTKREAAIKQAVESLGGKLESLYFMFGNHDVLLIVDAPDNTSVAALALTTGAAGVSTGLHSSVLLTPGEIDQAAQKFVSYQPPGQ